MIKRVSKGFTLIELIVVVSLVAIVIAVSTDIIVSVIRTYSKSQIQTEVDQNANFASLKIEKELRTARSVSEISSDSTQITFLDLNNREIVYTVSNGLLTRSVDGEERLISNNDTTNGVSVTCGGSCFSYSSAEGATPVVVRVNLLFSQRVSQTKKPFTASVKVDTTIVLRSSY